MRRLAYRVLDRNFVLVLAFALAGCVAPTDEGDADIGVTQQALEQGTGSVNREATVYQNLSGNNGGGFTRVCVGNVGTSANSREAFVRYTLPSIPSGSTVTRVRIVFNVFAVRSTGGPVALTLRMRRVTSSWTEGSGGTEGTFGTAGSQACGGGADVAGVDWDSRPSTVGPDSASHNLGTATGNVTIDSNNAGDSGLVTDVQAWVDGTTNHGWRLFASDVDNHAHLLVPGTLTVNWTLQNGQSCGTDSDCTSGNCINSSGTNCTGGACICCSAPTCTGVCQTCYRAGSVGTCGAEAPSVQCRSASCNGTTDVETLAANCTGSSTSCPSATTNPCNPYQCGATACRTSCTLDSHCLPISFCNGGLCEVITDECSQMLDDCDVNAMCMDPSVAVGDFTCMCNAGYSGDGHTGGTGCTDINECVLGTDDCDVNAACMNTVPGFACMCNSGFVGDGHTTGTGCTDVNECVLGTDNCDTNAMCTNTPGSFSCACNTGYRGSGVVCTEIDECAEGSDDCHADAMCMNTPGSWNCTCNSGFTGDGVTCTDINECLDPMVTGVCSTASTCNNLPGSWECVCNAGYRGDGLVCDDIDECVEGTDTCHAEATCTNTTGSFSCACNTGYRGSGFDCADIDECAEGTHGCGTNETCVNQIGMPNTCVCRPGFTRPDPMGECEASCGDGLVAPGEACDDANMGDGDGCSAICEIEPGWVCFEPTGTVSTCNMTCGDGFIDIGEECDDGPSNDDALADACRTTCERANCGDGTVDTGEECDDGADNDDTATDGCRTTCNLPYCGDGVIDSGEICDMGGGVPGAAVAGQCTSMCLPDAGLDPADPPALTGGACSCRAAPAPRTLPLGLFVVFGLLFAVRRRRR